MPLSAALIDSREPDWVQKLSFENTMTSVTYLDYGDIWCSTDDGNLIVVERKTEDDLLNTIKADRLFLQMAGLRQQSPWAYLVVCGPLRADQGGHIVTARGVTGWQFGAVWGALLTVQEMGVQVVFAASDQDFESCVLRIASRSREGILPVPPAKTPHIFDIGEQILASLPGIGAERVQAILEHAGSPAWALTYLTDTYPDNNPIPGIGPITKQNIRKAFGLEPWAQLAVVALGDAPNRGENGNGQQ